MTTKTRPDPVMRALLVGLLDSKSLDSASTRSFMTLNSDLTQPLLPATAMKIDQAMKPEAITPVNEGRRGRASSTSSSSYSSSSSSSSSSTSSSDSESSSGESDDSEDESGSDESGSDESDSDGYDTESDDGEESE